MVVKMNGVSLIRDNCCLLENITWEIRPGEHWAVIGLNGSGKTTLLKLISGNVRPSKGEMSVLGKRFGSYDLRELRRSIGWVSSSLQEQLPPYDTALDIVVSGKFASIGLYEKVQEQDFQRGKLLLEQLGCEHLINRTYSTLSQGEKQKLLIARALINSPKLLILDEPCTGLDIFAREQLLAIVERLSIQSDAPSLLYVSHHVEEILPCFSQTLLVRSGKIHSMGKTKEILTSNNLRDFFAAPVRVKWLDCRPLIYVDTNSTDI